MFPSWRMAVVFGLVFAAVSALALACGGGGGDTDKQDVEDVIRKLGAAGPSDIDYFIDHVTANALHTVVGTDEAGCRADAAACIGKPSTVTIKSTTVSGDTATVRADFKSGSDTKSYEIGLVKENGTWKIETLNSPTATSGSQ